MTTTALSNLRRVLSLALAAGVMSSAIAAQDNTIVIRAARIFDGRDLRAPGIVVVSGTLITSAGPTAQVPAGAQVIDVHLHAPSSEKNAIAMKDAAKQIHLENAVLIASQADLAKYKTWLDQSIPALPMPCEGGKMPNAGIPCVNDGSEWPKIAELRA